MKTVFAFIFISAAAILLLAGLGGKPSVKSSEADSGSIEASYGNSEALPAASSGFTQNIVTVAPVSDSAAAPPDTIQSGDSRLLTVYDASADSYFETEASEYLYGVLLAEMPSSFEDEALKAQAVAARTLILYKSGGCSDHPYSPVCTSSGHCMAYISPEDYITAAGEEAGGEYLKRVKDAVDSTDGVYLDYGGDPAMAVFHASSYTSTESAENVWGSDLPYLQRVYTPEQFYPDSVKKLTTTVTVEPDAFRKRIEEYLRSDGAVFAFAGESSGITSGYSLTDDYAGWLGGVYDNDTGRAERIIVGGFILSGKTVRSLFSLRSTDFTLEFRNGVFIFTVNGHGHGVGMSQYGANIMASQGLDFREILGKYYPGCVLKKAV